MKRFFYILFLSITVIFSFGFKSCEDTFCYFTAILTQGALGNGVYYVTDGNKLSILEWKVCETNVLYSSIYSLSDVDSRIGTSIDDMGQEYLCAVGDTGEVIWSSDGGNLWEEKRITGTTKNLYGFDFLDYGAGNLQVVVCGEQGIVYKSFNSGGGWAWQLVSTITTRNLTSIIAITTDLYIAVGDSGTIIRTTDGGQTWENKSVAQDNHFNEIFNGMPVDAYGHAWAVADNGRIFKTTSYGLSWFPQFSNTPENLNDVQFRDQYEGIIVGDNCTVRYTTDGGTSWLQNSYFDSLCTDGDILDIETLDFNTGIALIRNATLDGGATTTIYVVSSEPLSFDRNGDILPAKFILEQNYPNPFNPNTLIEFSIPEQTFVKLEIFNSLGEKISTLVSEEMNAGNYKYEWSAENLPSGIYFYKIKTDGFEQTKKLVLLK